jgi:hypothetical protein
MDVQARRGGVFAALGVVVIAAAVGVGWASARSGGAAASSRFEHTFPPDYLGSVWFTVAVDDDADTSVTAQWGVLRRSFVHQGPTPKTYFFERGVLDERQMPLRVEADRRVTVTFGHGVAPTEGIDIGDVPWEVLPFSHGTVPARPATADSATATASVVESVSYGGPVPAAGIGVREEPILSVPPFTRVNHGQTYEASCWVVGDPINNENSADPSDDANAYRSDIWWRIVTPAGEGFISDVWFSRRGNSDRLNLAECAESGA